MEDRSELLLVTPHREKKVFNEYILSAECQVKGCGWKRGATVVKDRNIEEAKRNFQGVNDLKHKIHKDSIKITILKD